MESCEFCGTTPGEKVLIQSASSRILWWNHRKIDVPLCGICAERVYYDQQSRTLVQGWWGPLSAIATIWFSIMNIVRIRKHREKITKIVIEGTIYPRIYLNVRKNFLAMGVTVAVIGGLFYFITSDTTDSSGQSSLGTCYQNAGVDQLMEIACGDSGADYRVSAIVTTTNDCPGYSTTAGENYACLEELR